MAVPGRRAGSGGCSLRSETPRATAGPDDWATGPTVIRIARSRGLVGMGACAGTRPASGLSIGRTAGRRLRGCDVAPRVSGQAGPSAALLRVPGAGIRSRAERRPRSRSGPGRRQAAPAWRSGPDAPATIELPVYFQWEFATGAGGDFESLVRRLRGTTIASGVGRRDMAVSGLGFGLPDLDNVAFEGALRAVNPAPPAPDAQKLRQFEGGAARHSRSGWPHDRCGTDRETATLRQLSRCRSADTCT